MVSNRNVESNGFGSDRGGLTYWISTSGPVDDLKSWRPVTFDRFRKMLTGVADEFPYLPMSKNQEQKHVTLFVHGYNNDWKDAARRYQSLCTRLFEPNELGICILFTWPSDGMVTNYLPDRSDARESAPDLADLLANLYDWLIQKQEATEKPGAKPCRAKTSMIAHSMGNYVLQNAMQLVWTRKNQPLLTSLINQLIMVAADVDNDLFKGGELSDKSDGDAIANLTYRVTALYTGLDDVLGMSAGLKHFGKRRLGRSGLDGRYDTPDNVWQYDCTRFLENAPNTHSAYFEVEKTIHLMRTVLQGLDREVIKTRLLAGAPSP
jgi:esterase/lipase superfamily enzyme